MAVQRIETNARRSKASVYGNMVYLTGQTAEDVSQDITGQSEQALASIDKLLAMAGTSKSHVLNVVIWVASTADIPKMNEVWDRWIDKNSPPTRACSKVEFARPEVKVEFLVTAAKP